MADSLATSYRARREKEDSIRKKALWLSLLQAAAAIFIILLSARYVTVLVLSLKEEPVFSAPKTIYLPQRELEHQMALSEFQNAAATPSTIPTLSTESLLANTPPLPAIQDVEFTPVENEIMITESDVLFGQSGLMGALGALSSQSSSVSFLGITEEAERFVIIVDCSDTVFDALEKAGSSMDVVKEETYRLIKNLNSNTLVGLIIHRRKFLPLSNSLIAATVRNKELAIEWINKNWPGKKGGSISSSTLSGKDGQQSILPVLDAAFTMQPDVIFLISDGGYRHKNNSKVALNEVLSLIRSRQKDLLEHARIHAIHFPRPKEDGHIGSKMRSIATRNGGEYRKIEK